MLKGCGGETLGFYVLPQGDGSRKLPMNGVQHSNSITSPTGANGVYLFLP